LLRKEFVVMCRRAVLALASLAGLLIASGCAFGNGDGGGVNDGELYSTLPLQAYRLESDERLYRVRLAEAGLIDACMRARGVSWNPPEISRVDATPEFRRYGVLHVEVAEAFGYREPIDPVRERRNRYVEGLTASQREAYAGEDSMGGCLAQAQVRLGQNVSEGTGMLLTSLGQQSLNASAKLPDVKAVKAEWSACMRERGYDYPEPFAAATDPAWDFGAPEPSAREREVAVADVRCKAKVGLAETWAEAEATVQERLIEANGPALEKIRQANDKILAAADRELRDGAQR
jgi:hypothetical protein